MALIDLRHVSKRFGWLVVLNDVSLSIEPGKCIVVIGASGTGKSVLLKHIVGLMKPDDGEVWFDGKRLDVLHGSLDRWLPGVPGVASSQSRRGFERARAMGVAGSYTLIRGGVHGLALRSRRGLVPLPRASTWARLVGDQLETFAGSET